jgi:large subunit ribosomal protein L30
MEKETKKMEKTEHKTTHEHNKLLVVIRIAGEVKVKPEVRETLDRLRLRRKYSCILVQSHNKKILGMVEKVKYHVAYGGIERDVLEKLVKIRGMGVDNKKFNAGDVSDNLFKGKSLNELGLKPFFRLHPPRGGIKSKLQYPVGVLGYNKQDINKLVERML